MHTPAERAMPVPRQLPPVLRDFTGRHDELAALDALLTGVGQYGTSVVVAGSAGIGKTSLVLRWAHRVQNHHFPDGSLFANLRGFGPNAPLEPGWVLGGFLTALGIPAGQIPADVENQAGLYRSTLAGKRVLTVLDNAATADQVRVLLPAAPGCVAVVTSRANLTGLAVSDAARSVGLRLFTEDEAHALLGSILGEERVAAEPDAVAALVELCDRLPLALRIAATRLAAHPGDLVADIVEDITNEQDRVGALSNTDETDMVSTVFDWSYAKLSGQHATTFRWLGLHPGAEMSEPAVAALTGLEPPMARRHLGVLAEMHLVESVGRRRYRMHELLHAYAAQRATHDDPAEQRQEALARLVTWYARSALAADRLVFPGLPFAATELSPGPSAVVLADRDAALSWLNTELLTLVQALHVASEQRWHASAIGLAASMRFLAFRERTLWPMLLEVETLGEAAARASGDRAAEGFLLGLQVDTLALLHRWQEVDDVGARLLELGRELGDPLRQCLALMGLGYARREQGYFPQARELYLAALPLAQRAGHVRSEAVVECNLGMTAAQIGQYQQALVHAERELVLRRQAGDRFGEPFAFHNAAVAWQGMGDHRVALEWAEQALALDRSLQATERHTATVLVTAAECLEQLSDRQRASAYLREAIDLLTQLGDPCVDEVRARLRHLDG